MIKNSNGDIYLYLYYAQVKIFSFFFVSKYEKGGGLQKLNKK